MVEPPAALGSADGALLGDADTTADGAPVGVLLGMADGAPVGVLLGTLPLR